MLQSHPLISHVSKRKIKGYSEPVTYFHVNPNKACLGMIRTYSELVLKLLSIFSELELDAEQFVVRRIDVSCNSENVGDYERFKKLYKALLLCISLNINAKNNYSSNDLWTSESRSLNVRNDWIEVEAYNKELENPNSPVTSRLEFRLKKLGKGFNVQKDTVKQIFSLVEASIQLYLQVQHRLNNILAVAYKEDLQKPQNERSYSNLTAFVVANSDRILTHRQLIQLLTMLNVKNPEKKAKKIKDHHKIESVTSTDLKLVTAYLKRISKEYFRATLCNGVKSA